MVVEDENLLLQAITKKLKNSNIDVVSCASGEQAFDYLKEMETPPDAIWLDYYLENMNGLDFMQRVKENEKWSNIPVVVVSNSTNQKKVHSMLTLGVKKYLLKANYRLDEIVEVMKEIINSSRAGEV
jgi:DNA-binding response OmpR family regulator